MPALLAIPDFSGVLRKLSFVATKNLFESCVFIVRDRSDTPLSH